MTPSELQENAALSPHFVGFWPRVVASLVDSILLMLISAPVLVLFYGWEYFGEEQAVRGIVDILVNYLLPVVAILGFWLVKQATPGKMAIHAVIVDARTGEKPSTQQFVIRYVGYIVAILPFFLGILWVAWDQKKQGWHDKMAGTVVIRRE